MFIRKTLDNGLRIICEKIPYVRSVSVGIWSGSGSRLEGKNTNGISHFAEHMLFKGTKTRSAKDIAEEIDFIGGYLNAFTARECTCYYAKAIDSRLEQIIDILSDMYINPSLNEGDIELEKKVIIEEINMYEDSPEDMVMDLLSIAAWGDDSIGYPVSGDSKSILKIGKNELTGFTEKYYNANNTVISVAGSFDEDELFRLLEKYFGKMRRGDSFTNFSNVGFHFNKLKKDKNIEQSHLCIGFPAAVKNDDEIYTLAVLNNVVGNGMSSRLFQNIRENRGLVYSIYSAHEDLQNAGLYYIYAGMSPSNLETVRGLTLREIESLIKNGVTEKELTRGREQLNGTYIMTLESVSARMNSMGRNELLQGEVRTPEEVIKGIKSVDMNAVNDMINKIFSKEYAESVVENSKEDN